jgi:hypothetical protein
MPATTKCNCYYCGKTVGKGQIKAHLLKELPHGPEECYLIKIESAYSKIYYLYVDAPLTATLTQLDSFMRKIWLECCGHLSEFTLGGAWSGNKVEKTSKLSSLNVGDVLTYIYDMGSSTELRITIVEKTSRPKQKTAARLLARNEAPEVPPCDKCGKPATQINSWNFEEFICDDCLYNETDYEDEDEEDDEEEDDYDEEEYMPILNSPRMGVCGYCGETDTFGFNPKKLLCSAGGKSK